MSKAHPPELKKFPGILLEGGLNIKINEDATSENMYSIRPELFMDKKLAIKLNAGRSVIGVLRGFDPFMNLVLDETTEECKDGQRHNIGMVVIRGNSIIMLESLDRI